MSIKQFVALAALVFASLLGIGCGGAGNNNPVTTPIQTKASTAVAPNSTATMTDKSTNPSGAQNPTNTGSGTLVVPQNQGNGQQIAPVNTGSGTQNNQVNSGSGPVINNNGGGPQTNNFGTVVLPPVDPCAKHRIKNQEGMNQCTASCDQNRDTGKRNCKDDACRGGVQNGWNGCNDGCTGEKKASDAAGCFH